MGSLGNPIVFRWMDGGEWGNETWADSCSGRRAELQSDGEGARPWILGRRNGHARGVYNRLVAGDRSPASRFSRRVSSV